MKYLFLLKALSFCMLTAGLVSCSKDDKDDNSNGQLEDGTGLRTTMSWTVSDGSDPSAFADLDLILYKGTGTSKTPTGIYADGSTTPETMLFPSTMDDGDYTIAVDYFTVDKAGSMNLAFKAESGTATYNINNNSFTTAFDGVEKDMIKITKSGNKFTIAKL